MHPRQLPSTFSASTEPSINFHQLIVCLWDLLKKCALPLDVLLISVNFLCILGTFCQLLYITGPSVSFCASAGLSINILFIRGTYRELPSTFRASEGPSIIFPCISGSFRQHKPNFRAATGLSSSFVNFLCVRVIILQLSVRQQNLPLTSNNFRCIHRTCHQLSVRWLQLPSSFRASAGHPSSSITFLCVHPSLNFVRGFGIYFQLP